MKYPLMLITALAASLSLAACSQSEDTAASADGDQVSLSAGDTAEGGQVSPSAGDTADTSSAETTETPAAEAAETTTLSGRLSYRERMALPEEGVIIVQLLDVSLADAPAEILAEKHLTPEGQVPVDFRLAYDPAEVQTNHRYALRGEIRDAQGELLWTTTEHHGVDLSKASPEVPELVLTRVAEPTPPAAETMADEADVEALEETGAEAG
ncbi:YbaY family lipoprotein [Bisbaumannia pacifica]|uniref:YbaY family lipoprotein n=1 Tax=Bisbaumannia pacifica TaxID=77098 RepID=A0ABD4KYC2_9GAMM|nr:YbaY family lipoprotein [Halomonas pacifica]MBH8579371.1 YbaY family lipoprotein [Halomonas pacifica]